MGAALVAFAFFATGSGSATAATNRPISFLDVKKCRGIGYVRFDFLLRSSGAIVCGGLWWTGEVVRW